MFQSPKRDRRLPGLKCAICSNTRRNYTGRFFTFPKNKIIYNIWISKTKLLSEDNKKRILCDKHFEKKCFGKRKLKLNSIPTLNLPDPESRPIIPDSQIYSFSEESIPVTIPLKTYSNTREEPQNIPLEKVLSSNFETPILFKENAIHSSQTENNVCINCERLSPVPCETSFCDNCLKFQEREFYYQKRCAILEKQLKNAKLRKKHIKATFFKSKLKNEKSLKLKLLKIKKLNTKLKSRSISKLIESSTLKENAKILIKMNFKEKTNWSEKEKNIALNIHFNSPKGYKFLRNGIGLNLPHYSSLNRWCPIKYFGVGFHDGNINQLKNIFSEMDEVSKECVLIFDEIAIRKDLNYNIVLDEITGFSDYGFKRTGDIAKYACVFLLRGIKSNWKYVLSYYSSQNGICGKDLTKILFSNLKVAFELNINIRAIVCDQGANNRKCFNLLGVSTHDPYFFFNFNGNQKKVYAIFDPIHLVKSLRNTLLKYDLHTKDGEVSFKIIRSLYLFESENQTKMCPKLSKKHIFPNTFEKMNVRLASQVFSKSVASAIKTLVHLNKFVQRKTCALSTAQFVAKIDKLFDCLNSKKLFDKNPYRSALQENNTISEYLIEMISYFEEIVPNTSQKIYCIDGMIQSLKAIIQLSKDMFSSYDKSNCYYILISRLNQDVIENLFSLVRYTNGCNNNPSISELNSILAKIISVKLINQEFENTNCEEDDANFLYKDLQSYSLEEYSSNEIHETDVFEETDEVSNSIINEIVANLNTEIEISSNAIASNSERYVCGYVLFKLLKKISCEQCKTRFLKQSNETLSLETEQFIFQKNYNTNSDILHLKAPTDEIFEVSKLHIKIFNEYFSQNYYKKSLLKNITYCCIEATKKSIKFPLWFSENDECNGHKIKFLEFLIILLLKKSPKWLKDKLLENEKETKVKKTDSKKHSNKLKIIKS